MRIRFWITGISAVLLVLGLSPPALQAQDKKRFSLRFHGFLLGEFTARTSKAHPPGEEGGRFLWADERLRLEIDGETADRNPSFTFKGDIFHDAVANTVDGLVREGYLDYSRSWMDLRIGRQIVTWGAGDLLFINDVFPKDWNAFFSGRPLEYLKLAVDAAKVRLTTPAINAELVVAPFFEPDNLPNPKRFFLFDPFQARESRLVEPATTAGNTEFGLRLYRRVAAADVSLYAYRGYWRQPSFRGDPLSGPTRLGGFYPRVAVYGASAQRNIRSALLSLEAGYYDSRDDRHGRDPAIPNPQVRFLVGYQRQLAGESTLGAQYYAEVMTNYAAYKATLPPGFPMQDRIRHLLTLRFTRFLKYQTWRLSFFTFYSPSDQDALVIPELWHSITDRLSVAAGLNLFAGRRQATPLGQLDRDDNLYVMIRFDF